MPSRKRSEVERVARELAELHRPLCSSRGYPADWWVKELMPIAAWHLREVRRARGRTVPEWRVLVTDTGGCSLLAPGTKVRFLAPGHKVARVVLVPAPRRKR